ncbi:hypothetical protein JGI5_01428 [Candidatus Kryptonium thompsonii]|nr:hypothetical protein JGI5_01428 [Candidatus Kryptonium thompsoni]
MKITLGLKLVADILTTLRFLIGLYIVRFSTFEPNNGVPLASVFFVDRMGDGFIGWANFTT